MRAGDRDALLQPHQLGEHLGAAHHGDAPCARRDHFDVLALDRRGDDDDRDAFDVGGVLPVVDGHALAAQPLHIRGLGDVGALHLVAEVDQKLGDAAHADAADADEVDRTEIERQFHANPLVSRMRRSA